VSRSLQFLNGGNQLSGVSTSVATAVLKTFEEDQLDLEERIQRCLSDARQYLTIRPEMAWSRAQQAVTLLGPEGGVASITDQSVRATVYLTAAEICFRLACRRTVLPAELGSPDLFHEAHRTLLHSRRIALAAVVR